jgi:hypothetical protein
MGEGGVMNLFGLASILLTVFGLIINWDGSIGEGQNFILAGLVFALLSGPIDNNFFKRRL